MRILFVSPQIIVNPRFRRPITLTWIFKNNYYLIEINIENNLLKVNDTVGFLKERRAKYLLLSQLIAALTSSDMPSAREI